MTEATAIATSVKRPSIPATDLERLNQLSGVSGNPAAQLASLLDEIEKLRANQAEQASGYATTIQWFTARIDDLEKQLAKCSKSQTTNRESIPAVRHPVRSTAPNTRSRAKIEDVIDAVLKWNTAQESPDRQLRVSIPVIRALAKLIESAYLPAINEALRAKEAELNEHHDRLMLGSRHNRRIADKTALLKEVARDYMGVPNWEQVEFC